MRDLERQHHATSSPTPSSDLLPEGFDARYDARPERSGRENPVQNQRRRSDDAKQRHDGDNLAEITLAYDSGWNRLTEKFYAKTEWPEAEVIAPLVNEGQPFLIPYRELYHRHVYSRLRPDIDDRFHSYENSCELFNYLLNSEDGPVPLQLPEQWL
ncbi:hypothetical protein V8E52_004323 [Russula decolorans]